MTKFVDIIISKYDTCMVTVVERRIYITYCNGILKTNYDKSVVYC